MKIDNTTLVVMIERIGKSKQIYSTQAKCLELAKAISGMKYMSKSKSDTKAHIVDALADVIIASQQLRLIVGSDKVDSAIVNKLTDFKKDYL